MFSLTVFSTCYNFLLIISFFNLFTSSQLRLYSFSVFRDVLRVYKLFQSVIYLLSKFHLNPFSCLGVIEALVLVGLIWTYANKPVNTAI